MHIIHNLQNFLRFFSKKSNIKGNNNLNKEYTITIFRKRQFLLVSNTNVNVYIIMYKKDNKVCNVALGIGVYQTKINVCLKLPTGMYVAILKSRSNARKM